MQVSFEHIPENYIGAYPYAIIRLKESQLTPHLESNIREALKDFKSEQFDRNKIA